MNKVVEIFKSWGIMFHPNEKQNKLAYERLNICNGCEFKQSFPIHRCTVCGCALKAKVFTPVENGCPKGKWEQVDKEFLIKEEAKKLI